MRSGVDGAFIRAAATWDLNHDGNVTCEEWRQYAASVFKDADLNHDGKLTPEEFDRLAKIDRLFEIANFKYYDVNGQGYVTQAEFIERPNPAFLQLDKEKTCVLKTYQLRAATMPDAPKRDNPGIPGSR
jgi:Ca2+-binding EF-hand superfamily protein